MKKNTLLKSLATGIVCLLSFQQAEVNAGESTARTYPYAQFSNNSPSAGEKISVRWYIGLYRDACVPSFETSITKKVSDTVVSYYLNFKEIPDDRKGMACAQVLTAYGPKFEIGPFDLTGYTYKIYIDTQLVREFRIDSKKYPYPIVIPKEPRAGDTVSVQWILGEDSVNCVMQYAGTIEGISLLKSNPPIHVVTVNYKETPVEYFACIPRPTLYGPTFDLGKVEGGDYVIYYDTAVVAKFTVTSQGEVPPEVTFLPEQPFEGDSLKLKLILGRGSSSCAPRYITDFERTFEGNGVYEYALTYETIQNTNTNCTKDYAPFGPQWIVADVKPGTHIFRYQGNGYYKVFVEKKREIPIVSDVTIKGTVYEINKGSETTDSNLRAAVVPKCTVMVVIDNVIAVKKSEYFIDSIISSAEKNAGTAPTVAPKSTFMAVTNESGEYVIGNVPSLLLLNRSYTVASKNGYAGYGVIPAVLTEEIVSNITLYKVEVFVDSVRNILKNTEEVVSLLKQQGLEKA